MRSPSDLFYHRVQPCVTKGKKVEALKWGVMITGTYFIKCILIGCYAINYSCSQVVDLEGTCKNAH